MLKTILASLLTLTTLVADPIPVIDRTNSGSSPPKFRKFDDLRASGSAQFSENEFKGLLKELNNPKNLYILDLRNESHGFINGDAVVSYVPRDWGNRGLSPQEAELNEKRWLASFPLGSKTTFYRIAEHNDDDQNIQSEPFDVDILSVSDEKSLVESYGAHYVRIRVVDHEAPSTGARAAFIKLIKDLPQDAWLHIHCRGGAGRTTTFLLICDILKNGKNKPLKEMIERQHLSGGSNLLDTQKQPWKVPFIREKIQFIETFYNDMPTMPTY